MRGREGREGDEGADGGRDVNGVEQRRLSSRLHCLFISTGECPVSGLLRILLLLLLILLLLPLLFAFLLSSPSVSQGER